ncbi:hypothetical protein QYF36_015288 [Acer negundo]|nr:hypothetical protein QYF36_015288 [Acer negundo]
MDTRSSKIMGKALHHKLGSMAWATIEVSKRLTCSTGSQQSWYSTIIGGLNLVAKYLFAVLSMNLLHVNALFLGHLHRSVRFPSMDFILKLSFVGFAYKVPKSASRGALLLLVVVGADPGSWVVDYRSHVPCQSVVVEVDLSLQMDDYCRFDSS